MIWVLVGHRGTGKTKLGRRASEVLSLPFFDLDEVIEKETGRSPASWISESEKKFRELELETLEKFSGPALVAAGGGVEAIPPQYGAIWLWRKGWKEKAKERVPRIRPDLTMEEELAWMIETREPRYLKWANAIFKILERDERSLAATKLATLIRRLEDSKGSNLFKKSWWIGEPDRIKRQVAKAEFVEAAGVEVRSDIFASHEIESLVSGKERILFSVRSQEGEKYIEKISHIDIDLQFDSQVLAGVPKSQVICSCHPTTWIAPSFPKGAENVKWAPTPRSFSDLRLYEKWKGALRSEFKGVTVLPQTSRWTWLRILEAVRSNQWNYISGQARPHESGAPAWDVWSFYAHVKDDPQLFGIIGDPVAQSAGPEFHNLFFRKTNSDALYVAIPVPREELEDALEVLMEMGFSGLSVTSPHKRAILECKNVQADALAQELGAANTLHADSGGKWQASDTDGVGMKATLSLLDLAGVRKVLLLGQGGVSAAVQFALKEVLGFKAEHHGARSVGEGQHLWREPWDMVINASGKSVKVGPEKKPKVWIDLRYGFQASNDGGEVFVSGDKFFEAQAKEQLRIWGFSIARSI